MNIQYIHPADQLVMFMQRIYDKGLTTTSGGNLSIMDSDGNIWITPASVDKGTLNRKDIICVHPDGSCEGPHKPSSELPFHQSVYRMRPDLKAVLHAHPPALVAFSIIRKIPNLDLIPSVRKVCPEVRIAKYDVPGSDALGERIGTVFADGCDIAILENHGVCIGAPDMFMAFQRFETLNYSAELEILAGRIGTVKSLDKDAQRLTATNDHTKLDDFIPRVYSSEELSARRDMITLIKRSYRMGLFIPVKSAAELRAAGTILQAITSYVMSNRWVAPGKSEFIRQLDRYIEDHLNQRICAEDICAAFCIGHTRLYELCMDYLGCGLAEYIRGQRIHHAQRFLKETALPVTEIAYAVGFSDYSHFSRIFKQYTGLSARTYRKTAGNT